MYGQQYLETLIHQRHEEALKEAQARHLLKRARTSQEPRGLRRVGLAWSNALTLLRGA